MPYIDEQDRTYIDEEIDLLVKYLKAIPSGKVGGALNYAICRLAVNVMEPKGYTETSDMLGHVVSAERELRRRLLDPYEDKCVEKNGDLEEFSDTKAKPGSRWSVSKKIKTKPAYPEDLEVGQQIIVDGIKNIVLKKERGVYEVQDGEYTVYHIEVYPNIDDTSYIREIVTYDFDDDEEIERIINA